MSRISTINPNLPGAELSAATARRMLQGLLF